MKTISTKTGRELLHAISIIAFACISPISLVINGVLLSNNISFFGEQSLLLEKRWLIFTLVTFPIVLWFITEPYASDSYAVLFFWGTAVYLMISLTPVLILLLKELALIYGF